MRGFLAKIMVFLSFTLSAAAVSDSLLLQPGSVEFSGIYTLREFDPNLTGGDVNIISVCRSLTYIDGQPAGDFGVDANHPCFAGKTIKHFGQPNTPTGISNHSTSIASILIGEDAAGSYDGLGEFYYEGVLPDANLSVYEFWYFIKEKMLAGDMPKADILTMSIGSTYPDWWTRGFERMAQEGVVVVAGIGNGSDAFDPVLYPGASGNVIGVGVVDCVIDTNIVNVLTNYGLANSLHSSIGPTDDNRCKPDIVAPGNCLVPDANGNYKMAGNWSSFATPIASGTAGLLLQKAKQMQLEIDNTAIKAILMNSADKLPYWHKGDITTEDDHTAVLDRIQGAGLLNAVAAMDCLITDDLYKLGWDGKVIDSNSTMVYSVKSADPNDEYITATLVWNNQYQAKYPFALKKAVDFRLELWAMDANDPSRNYMLDYSDCLAGTVEHIYTKADANFTDYQLVVSYSQPTDGQQHNYAIAWDMGYQDISDNVLLYDLDNDGIVSTEDVNIVIENLGKASESKKAFLPGDINMNGQIETEDIKHIIENKGKKAFWKE